MNTDLGDYRRSYEKQELLESNISDNPMEVFQKWFYEVDANYDEGETNAMTISTLSLDGFPKSRVVLLKKYTHEGFIFYTNYKSEKGRDILANPKVCLSFFWPKAERQVIIKGTAEKVSANMSDGYFESRPRGSQLGALVSHQSEVVKNRKVLEEELHQLEEKYEGKDIPRPEHWGGFIVKPISIEFWQGRPNRLHDRIRFQLNQEFDWVMERLSP
ncbi:MAG: pyridoxamine 5'-phosphate oxidase [Gelidibacter sp.]